MDPDKKRAPGFSAPAQALDEQGDDSNVTREGKGE